MTPEEPKPFDRLKLLAVHRRMCQQANEVMQAKNADYAGHTGVQPFANFTRCENLNICRTEIGMLTRMCDKFSRLISFVNSGQLKVKDESIQDTCVDLINYSILLYAYLAQQNGWEDSDGEKVG